MKKVIFGLIATVCMSVSSFANNKSELKISQNFNLYQESFTEKNNAHFELENNLEVAKVKVSVRVGRKSRGCSGFGICEFKATLEMNFLEVDVYYDPDSSEGGEIAMRITPELERELINYFGKSALIIEEDFEITDPRLIQELGLNNRFVIGTGTYSTQDGRILIKNSVR